MSRAVPVFCKKTCTNLLLLLPDTAVILTKTGSPLALLLTAATGAWAEDGVIMKELTVPSEWNNDGTNLTVDEMTGIACADRWMPQWYVKPLAKQIISGMKRHFADYRPDASPRKAEPLPGKEIHHGENTSVSRYVWLPIDWEGDRPMIRWRKEWRVEG